MDKDKPETQNRSSFGRVNAALIGTKNDSWLIAPAPSKKAFVELHIRRAQGTPIHECVPDPDDPDNHLDVIDIDLIDDASENKPPFIIFRFNFVPLPTPERNADSSKTTVPRKRKHLAQRQSTSNARKRQVIGDQEPPRHPSPVSDSDSRDSPAPRERDQGESLVDQLAAARKKEEALDAELEAQLQAANKRIAEKQKLLEKYSITV
ncbi:hypothetical protein B0H16DRAFT_1513586 [Mycena metata]|uniref:Uncharacterized protein n=1 Tax=Mycena metata TaxID=1033252 RepID=A0AAD7JVL0_9AGAR|nr:hypothetical protein B0H16DRAFT_1513586 [Mycena metata]